MSYQVLSGAALCGALFSGLLLCSRNGSPVTFLLGTFGGLALHVLNGCAHKPVRFFPRACAVAAVLLGASFLTGLVLYALFGNSALWSLPPRHLLTGWVLTVLIALPIDDYWRRKSGTS